MASSRLKGITLSFTHLSWDLDQNNSSLVSLRRLSYYCKKSRWFWSFALREKCPNTEFFWSEFLRFQSKYLKMRTREIPYLDTFRAALRQNGIIHGLRIVSLWKNFEFSVSTLDKRLAFCFCRFSTRLRSLDYFVGLALKGLSTIKTLWNKIFHGKGFMNSIKA